MRRRRRRRRGRRSVAAIEEETASIWAAISGEAEHPALFMRTTCGRHTCGQVHKRSTDKVGARVRHGIRSIPTPSTRRTPARSRRGKGQAHSTHPRIAAFTPGGGFAGGGQHEEWANTFRQTTGHVFGKPCTLLGIPLYRRRVASDPSST